MRRDFLPFALPTITDAEIDEVVATLRSGWITTGPRAKRFEHDFAAYVGAPHAVAITARTRAVIPVHLAGQPCDMDPLLALARAHGLAVVEDAAHALPARYKGHRVGTLGDLAAFSFYATKPITTAEGGMVTTASPDYAQRVARMSLHGISTDAWQRDGVEGSWFYEVEAPGYKYNMPDLAAALGLAQLRRCDALWSRRATIAAQYDAAFADLQEIATPVVSPDVQHAWHLYIIRLDLDALEIDRAGFIRAMHALNIGTSVHFIPLHLHPYYRRTTGHRPDDFPVAMRVYPRVVSLPIYPSMSDGDVADVVDAVRAIVTRYRRRRALAGSGVAAGEASAASGVPHREAAV